MSPAPAFDAAWLRSIGAHRADLPFWEAWDAGRFLLHRCRLCSKAYWPSSQCVEHGPAAMHWTEASGLGVVHTWTEFHRHYSPDVTLPLPYNVAVVRLDEDCFFHTRIIDLESQQLHSGLRVELAPPLRGTLPLFRPSSRPR